MSAYETFMPTAAALLDQLSQRREIQPKTSMRKHTKSKRKVRARAPGMTQISISLPEGLVGKIDEMADTENRNRSNFIATVLKDLSKQRGAGTPRLLERAG